MPQVNKHIMIEVAANDMIREASAINEPKRFLIATLVCDYLIKNATNVKTYNKFNLVKTNIRKQAWQQQQK